MLYKNIKIRKTENRCYQITILEKLTAIKVKLKYREI